MKIFNNKTAQTSNDYYEAYKAELGGEVEKKKFFSLNNFLKLEIVAVALGFFILTQNDLSSEFKKMYTAGNDILPVSMQYASLDKDLVVTQEDTSFEKITIREDDIVTKNILDEEAFVNNVDIKLLIELLQSEMKEKRAVTSDNRIIISQK